MAITIDLPADLESELRARSANLDVWAGVAFAFALYRNKEISIQRFAEVIADARRALDDADDPTGPDEVVASDAAAFKYLEADLERYQALSAKARAGALSPAEGDELDALLDLDAVLSLFRLQSLSPAGDAR